MKTNNYLKYFQLLKEIITITVILSKLGYFMFVYTGEKIKLNQLLFQISKTNVYNIL